MSWSQCAPLVSNSLRKSARSVLILAQHLVDATPRGLDRSVFGMFKQCQGARIIKCLGNLDVADQLGPFGEFVSAHPGPVQHMMVTARFTVSQHGPASLDQASALGQLSHFEQADVALVKLQLLVLFHRVISRANCAICSWLRVLRQANWWLPIGKIVSKVFLANSSWFGLLPALLTKGSRAQACAGVLMVGWPDKGAGSYSNRGPSGII